MIRINLARTPGSKGKKGGKKGSSGPLLVTLLVLVLLGGGGYYYYTEIHLAADESETAKAPAPPVVPKPDAPPSARPSSQVRTQMVENVVKEFDNDVITAAATRGLNTPYALMTTPEKINYEVLFGRNIFNMITKCTPPGIKFRTLEIENFQTVYASGAGLSRHMVQEMFTAFRNERGELLPKPYSNIKDDPGTGGNFTFTIAHKPNFGLEVGDPFQALDHLGFRDGLPQSVREFSRIAGANNFKMSAAPSQITVERAGNYRRVVYRATGMSTYKDFHKFVLALYSEKLPVAFKKVSMTPVRDEQVRVTAEILFTVKE